MVALPFPTSSSPGVRPQEGGGRLINAFARKMPTGARAPIIYLRSPGLRELVAISAHTHCRGFIEVGSTLLVVLDNRVYSIVDSGGSFTATNLGALLGSGAVTIAKNNAATPQIVAVTENGAFNLFTGSAPTAFADADLPVPNSVTMLNGYLVFTIGDGRIFATNLNSVSVSSLSFTTEQGLALRRGVTYAGRFIAFGDKWTGVYRDIGASPFPFEREVTVPRGIIGTNAVAGWEPGWANELQWVGDDYIVYQLDGYRPKAVSTDDVSRDIEAAVLAGDASLLEACVYMYGREAFWTLTYPDNWTWEYNTSSGEWNERKSYNEDDWRGRQAVKAFNRWVVGDKDTGKIGEIVGEYKKEFGNPLIWQVDSGIAHNFPSRLAIPRIDFDITTAVGVSSGEDPIETDPKVQISWSLDGGFTWGNPVTRRLGAEGDAHSHPSVLRGGLTKGAGVRYRLRVSDPVHVGFSGAQFAPEQRAE